MNKETFDYEINKIFLKKRDILAITIKSNDFDSKTVESLRKELKPKFPDNEVLIVFISSDEDVKYTCISKE